MDETEKLGMELMIRYNDLKKKLDRSAAMLIALRDSGGPGVRREHPALSGSGKGSYISTESLIREVLRVSKYRQALLTEMCRIEEAVKRLPYRLMRILQWRYILKAKREPIARRLGVSLRHYSRLKKQALIALGEIIAREEELQKLLG